MARRSARALRAVAAILDELSHSPWTPKGTSQLQYLQGVLLEGSGR